MGTVGLTVMSPASVLPGLPLAERRGSLSSFSRLLKLSLVTAEAADPFGGGTLIGENRLFLLPRSYSIGSIRKKV